MATRIALAAPALAMAATLAAPLVSAQSGDDAAMFPSRVVISGSTAIRPLVRRVGAILTRAAGAERASTPTSKRRSDRTWTAASSSRTPSRTASISADSA